MLSAFFAGQLHGIVPKAVIDEDRPCLPEFHVAHTLSAREGNPAECCKVL